MKKKVFVFFLLASISFAFIALKNRYAIKTADSSEFIIINWRMTPSYVTDLKRPLTFTFHLKNKKNRPITDAKVSVEANMNHPGMTPIYAEAIHDQNGFYKSTFNLTMEGDWILFLTIKTADGEIVKKELFFSTKADK